MTDDKGVFDGFSFLADMIVRDDNSPKPHLEDKNDNIIDIEPDELEKKMKQDNDPDLDLDKDDDLDDKKKDADPPKKDDKKKDKDDKDDKDKLDVNDEFEKEISSYFANEFSKKIGLELEDDVEIETIDDVLDLLKTVVEENSKPSYANDEVEVFDNFVRQGGDLRNFYDKVYSGRMNIDAIDIKNESDQKSIIKEHLVNQGYSEAKIKRALERYEESGVLEEEAEDALELIKDYNTKNAEKLLREQEKYHTEQQKMKQEFMQDVNTTMKNVSELAGVPITDREKRDLLNYIFVTDREGATSFQKDAQKDVMSLLEVAFFTKNKDRVINKTKKKATSDAYKTLQEKIRMQKGKLGKSGSQIQDDNSDMDSLGSFGKGIIF
jgi:hypothetical protein